MTKKQELRVSQITIRDPRSFVSPAEYSIWQENWD